MESQTVVYTDICCLLVDVPWYIEKMSLRNRLNIFRELMLFAPNFCAKLIILLSIFLDIKMSTYEGAGLLPMAPPIFCLKSSP